MRDHKVFSSANEWVCDGCVNIYKWLSHQQLTRNSSRDKGITKIIFGRMAKERKL